ncbi:MAG: DUF1499 domain-containing protein [Capsulimonadales bacterium]|nr:DUF1499 domain-containing protein [Capsulimonadales bacterium]
MSDQPTNRSQRTHRSRRFLLQALCALAIGTVAALAWQVPPAGWTSNDVTTGRHPGYPDLQPRRYDMSVENTTTFASEALRRVPGGKVTRTVPAGGRVHGEAQVLGTPFVDDVEILVTPENGHSLVTIRSRSRVGKGDLGVNAARIRAIQSTMDEKLPRL